MSSLKKYLIINSIFSAISGFTMMLFSSKLNETFNINNTYVFPIIGANLLVFSAYVWYVASRKEIPKKEVKLITILDSLWVLGSIVIVAFDLFELSSTGRLLISIVAVWIAFLAYKQSTNNK